jgi:predicted DNA-binding transcriptional regulator AlpA
MERTPGGYITVECMGLAGISEEVIFHTISETHLPKRNIQVLETG